MSRKLCYLDSDFINSPFFDAFIRELKRNNIGIFTIVEDSEMAVHPSDFVDVFIGEVNQYTIEKICLEQKKNVSNCFMIFPENKIELRDLPKQHLFEIKESNEDWLFRSLKSVMKYFRMMRFLRYMIIFITMMFDLFFLSYGIQNHLMFVLAIVLNGCSLYLLVSPLSINSILYVLELFIEML